MLRMLKTLCVLLKVLMLMRAAITISSEDLKDRDIISTINNHYIFKSVAKFKFVQNYADSVTVKNKAEGSPSEPRRPKAYVEFDNRLDEGDNTIIKFRWRKPKITKNEIQGYTVQYWLFKNQKKRIYTIHNISATTLQIIVSKVIDQNYYFQVQAHNEVGAGPYTKFIKVSPTHENPVPLLLINSWHSMKVLDMDLQTVFTLNEYRAKEIIYSALEHKIYWINEMWELVLSDFKPNIMKEMRNYTKITDLDTSAHNLCIDWIARNLYWIEISNQTSNIMKLDLTSWQQTGIAKYESIVKRNFKFKLLNILPSRGYFYWIELNPNNKNVIMQSDLDGKNMTTFPINEDTRCSCRYNLSNASSMQIDTDSNKPLMYWTSKDGLIVGNISGCECNLILKAGNQTFFDYLTIGKTKIYLFSRKFSSKFSSKFRSKKLIYIIKKKYALLESKEIPITHVQKVHVILLYIKQVIALDRSLQSYTNECLIPKREDYHVKKETITANSIVVSLPEPIPNSGCEKNSLVSTEYIISVSHCSDNNEFKEFNVHTYELQHKILNLTPFTEYTLKLALSNFYVDKLRMSLHFGTDMILKTAPDKLNAPENVTVQVLTPTLAKIYWMPPKKLNCAVVNYEVHWLSVLFPNDTGNITFQMPPKQLIDNLEHIDDGKVFTKIQLSPGREYLVYVRVYPGNFSNFFTDSSNKSIYMYSKPNNLTLSGVSKNSMNISWILSVNLTINYSLQYKNDAMLKWEKVYNIVKNNDKVTYYIENLLLRTLYKFRLILRYREHMEDFIWPLHEEFTFRTLGNVPSAPGIPTRLPNITYQLNWEAAEAHDSQVTLYRLEGLIVENNNKEGNQIDRNKHWILYYNGTDNYWIITGDMKQKYRFRVKAENAYGFGKWSESSAVIDFTEPIETSTLQYHLPLILCLVVTLVIYVCYFYCSCRQRRATNEQVPPSITTNIELPTVNEIFNSENISCRQHSALGCNMNPSEFTEQELQEKLRTFKLNTAGPKNDLISRLMEADPTGVFLRESNDVQNDLSRNGEQDLDESEVPAKCVSGAEVSWQEMEIGETRRERKRLELELAVARWKIEFLRKREREILSNRAEDGDRERDGSSESATSGGSGGDD